MSFEIKMMKRDARGYPIPGQYLEETFETAAELADFYNRNAASPRDRRSNDNDNSLRDSTPEK